MADDTMASRPGAVNTEHTPVREALDEDGVDSGDPIAGEPDLALVGLPDGDRASNDGSQYNQERGRTWEQELPRWLTTLDSPRTRQEYQKAVTYFFRTPGVPEALDELTFDLLMAYRGSLAIRAEGRQGATSRPTRRAHVPSDRARVGDQTRVSQLPPSEAAEDGESSAWTGGEGKATGSLSLLAPATANIRLTALRQFLAHCSLWGLLPRLSLDRIRAALRRLSIERRRPYHILAEPEWAAFLDAARRPSTLMVAGNLPSHDMPQGDEGVPGETRAQTAERTPVTDSLDQPIRSGPWGTSRALRRRSATASHRDDDTNSSHADATPPKPNDEEPVLPMSSMIRSRAGLTGARTAQRDHALLSLALATGLRAIELCELDVGDLTREWHGGKEEWWLVLPDVKTKGQRGGRTLPLAPSLVATLLAYLRTTGREWERSSDRASPMFLSQRSTSSTGAASARRSARHARLSPVQVRRIVDRVETQWIAARTGAIEDVGSPQSNAISPHALRHSTAVALLEGNQVSGRPPASVEHVRGWLGHFDIRTTQGYLAHLDARRHRRPFVLQPAPEQQDSGPTAHPHPQAEPHADR
jgi:integrase